MKSLTVVRFAAVSLLLGAPLGCSPTLRDVITGGPLRVTNAPRAVKAPEGTGEPVASGAASTPSKTGLGSASAGAPLAQPLSARPQKERSEPANSGGVVAAGSGSTSSGIVGGPMSLELPSSRAKTRVEKTPALDLTPTHSSSASPVEPAASDGREGRFFR